MKLPAPITNAPHRCEFSFRNPRNHLTRLEFTKLLNAMMARGDQRIICPGCKREIYLSMQVEPHNKPGHHRA